MRGRVAQVARVFGRVTGLGRLCILAASVLCLLAQPATAVAGVLLHRAATFARAAVVEEDALLTWDSRTRREHLAFRVVFDTDESAIAWLVPVPSTPTVSLVPDRIWDLLLDNCRPPRFGPNAPGGFGLDEAASSDTATTGITSDEIFDVDIALLKAHDTDTLTRWIERNELRTDVATREWLRHYGRLGYDLVALRRPQRARGATASNHRISRTLHLAFETLNPYFPYHEPIAEPHEVNRALRVWFLSDLPMTPIGLVSSTGNDPLLARPWSEGAPCRAGNMSQVLRDVLDEPLGYAGSLLDIQFFADIKAERAGWGDVLMIPQQSTVCDSSCASERQRLARSLFASVGAPPDLDSSPEPSAKKLQARRCLVGCALHSGPGAPRGDAGSWIALFVVCLMCRQRRKRVLGLRGLPLVLMACACSSCKPGITKHEGSSYGGASDSSGSAVLSNEHSRRASEFVQLLSGHLPDQAIDVWSRPDRAGIGGVRSPAPQGFPNRASIVSRCVSDARLEGIVRYRIHLGASGGWQVEIQGPLPQSMLECMRSELLLAVSGGSIAGLGEQRGFLSIGPTGNEYRDGQARAEPKVRWLRRAPSNPTIQVTAIHGSLSNVEANVIIRQALGRFGLCHRALLDRSLEVSGKVTLHLVIACNGAVMSTRAEDSNLTRDSAFRDCVEHAMSGIAFPRCKNEATTLTLTLAFDGPEGQAPER